MTKITKTLFKEALNVSIGTQTDMAKRLKVACSTMTEFLQKNKDMKELLEKKRSLNVSLAEDVIFKQLKFSDPKNKSSGERIRQNAAQFILSRLGRNKGWVEKQELDIKDERTRIIVEKANDANNKMETKPKAGTSPDSS